MSSASVRVLFLLCSPAAVGRVQTKNVTKAAKVICKSVV